MRGVPCNLYVVLVNALRFTFGSPEHSAVYTAAICMRRKLTNEIFNSIHPMSKIFVSRQETIFWSRLFRVRLPSRFVIKRCGRFCDMKVTMQCTWMVQTTKNTKIEIITSTPQQIHESCVNNSQQNPVQRTKNIQSVGPIHLAAGATLCVNMCKRCMLIGCKSLWAIQMLPRNFIVMCSSS